MEKAVRLAIIFVALLAAALMVTAPAAAAASADVAGEWNLAVETPNGPGTPTVVFKQDGENLTGTYKGRYGESPLKGTVKGNEIKFNTTINAAGQELEIEYTGTVEGSTMKGKVKFGEMGEGTFTGKKAAAKPPA